MEKQVMKAVRYIASAGLASALVLLLLGGVAVAGDQAKAPRHETPSVVATVPLARDTSSNIELDSASALVMSDGSVGYQYSITPPLDLGPFELEFSADPVSGTYSAVRTTTSGTATDPAFSGGSIIAPDSIEGTYQSRAYLRTLDPVGYLDSDKWVAETRNLLRWYVDPYNCMSTVSYYYDGAARHPTFANTNWYRDYLVKSGPYYNPEPTHITLAVWADYWNQDWLTSAYTYVETQVNQTANLDGTSTVQVVKWEPYGESYLLLHSKLVHKYGF